jgi:signal transduction histidine kinase
LRFLYVYLLLIVCARAPGAGAQPVTNLATREGSIVLPITAFSWYADTSGKQSLENIRNTPFSDFPQKQLLTISTHWKIWAKTEFQNQTGADAELVWQVPKSGYAQMFTGNKDSLDGYSSGSLLPLNERSVKANVTAFRVPIKKDQRMEVWIQLSPVYSIYIPRSYQVSVMPLSYFEHRDKQRLLWQGLFLGVILVMILYNLFIGIAVRDINYLYYVLSIAGIGTYFAFYYGFGIEYLWPRSPYWDTFCYLLIVPFNGLTRLLFTRTYLHTPTLLPNTNRIMNGLIIFDTMLFLGGLFAFLSRKDIIYPLLDIIGIVNTAIHCLMLVAGIIAYYRERYQPAKYFIWANIVLVIGAILFIGRELGFLEDNFMTRYLVQIGALIQVVVFSLGLASRLNIMRSQLAHETLERERMALEKEREKKELIEQQRKDLQLQVEQQTADLLQKNLQLESSIGMVKESEQKLTQLNQVKDKLFTIISHDLRNPLATMQSFLKLITDHHDKMTAEEKEKLFVQAQQSLDHLNELMYNLLQWSRSQMNLLSFRQERFPIRPVLENSARLLQLHAHMKDITIHVQADEHDHAFADREMTEFVVRNLISNAIKFSHRNNEVWVKAAHRDGNLFVEVRDQGIGMNEARIRKLMDMQTTISRRGTEKEKGTGLGLLISKEFILKNKGKLLISSEAGKGSSFSFTLLAG